MRPLVGRGSTDEWVCALAAVGAGTAGEQSLPQGFARSLQQAVPRFRESALLGMLQLQPGLGTRLRAWRQSIERALRRRDVTFALAMVR